MLGREGRAVEYVAADEIAVGELVGPLARVREREHQGNAGVDGDGVRGCVAGNDDPLNAPRAAEDGLNESPATLDHVDPAGLGPNHPNQTLATFDPGGGCRDEMQLIGGVGNFQDKEGGPGRGRLLLRPENPAGEVRGDL